MPGQVAGTPNTAPSKAAPCPPSMAQPLPPRLHHGPLIPFRSISRSRRPSPRSQGRLLAPQLPTPCLPPSPKDCSSQAPPWPSQGRGAFPATTDSSPRSQRGKGSQGATEVAKPGARAPGDGASHSHSATWEQLPLGCCLVDSSSSGPQERRDRDPAPSSSPPMGSKRPSPGVAPSPPQP